MHGAAFHFRHRMARVLLSQVSKSFADRRGARTPVLDRFDLEAENGEFLVIVGPSGCGKSTILRLIAGLEKPDAGEITIGTKVVNGMAPKDRDIAMVFQNAALYPHLTVRENLGFGLVARKFTAAEITRRVTDAAHALEIAALLDRRPGELSGGQQRRVAIGRAMVSQPKVFLFDEPLSNLDPNIRAQIRSEIIKLHQRLQTTMIYVTHDQVEAMTMGGRMVVMDAVADPASGQRRGVIQQSDAPHAVYSSPANLFVAGFIGQPPMNLVKGVVKGGADGFVFKETSGGTVEFRLPGDTPFPAGKEVIAGFRPEHCPLVAQDSGKGTAGLADVVEVTGPETLVTIQTGAHTIVSRNAGSGHPVSAGRRVRFVIETSRVVFFDPVTGAAIR